MMQNTVNSPRQDDVKRLLVTHIPCNLCRKIGLNYACKGFDGDIPDHQCNIFENLKQFYLAEEGAEAAAKLNLRE